MTRGRFRAWDPPAWVIYGHDHCPVLRRLLRGLLHVDLPGQPGDRQLDSHARRLRRVAPEGEYSHTVNALVVLIALCSVTLSGITARQD
jgi:hypothetical protein